MKDNFSKQSDNYAKYRPTYPDDFFEFLKSIHTNDGNAWDCGTGNGQVAMKLAEQYKNVFATDISQAQLDNAMETVNVFYSLQPAEKTNFPDNFFDLIIVAQAIHWFDFKKFYQEVFRNAKENALIVVIGYGRLKITDTIDAIIDDFYFGTIGSYWDKERKYIDENYLTIPFPFEEVIAPHFKNEFYWTFDQLIGYLGTWSAVKHYFNEKGINPIDSIYENLGKHWGIQEKRQINFPLLLRIGRIKKTENLSRILIK
jgi:ubiquinone/menaquinone biosynthesis C-methylase UbiE